jgi:hypothetical protein
MTNPDALQTTIGHSLAFFRSQKNYRYNGIFLEPVDPNLFPSYCRFCQTPMDLFNMKKKWDAGKYNVDDEGAAFWADVRLIVDNCQAYNSRPVGGEGWSEATAKTLHSKARRLTKYCSSLRSPPSPLTPRS